jgi:hypothetical protein
MSLRDSIFYVNMAVYLFDADSANIPTVTYVPIIVAKIDVYLKEKGHFNTESTSVSHS